MKLSPVIIRHKVSVRGSVPLRHRLDYLTGTLILAQTEKIRINKLTN